MARSIDARAPLFRSRALAPISFATSSVPKFLQARHVLELSGLEVVQLANHTEPYEEQYDGGPDALMSEAVAQIRRRPGGLSLFFVEDTSVRIEGLSRRDTDVPGLRTKEWFIETPFDALDKALKGAGTRAASVTSRIAMSVPGLRRPVMFDSTVKGTVAETPPDFVSDPLYPWLNSEDFSAWFVPRGSDGRRLGEMALDESYRFDHRTLCLLKLVDHLEEFAALLNLPNQVVRLRETQVQRRTQLPLFPLEGRRDAIIIGSMCAGKSTAAQQLFAQHGYVRLEGSGLLHAAAEEAGVTLDGAKAEIAGELFAREGPDAVESYIAEHVLDRFGAPVVYSGVRTMEGLGRAVQALRDPVVVALVSPDRSRFERCLRRAREGDPTTWAAFKERDAVDDAFGLMPFATDVADVVIRNSGRNDDLVIALERAVAGWDGGHRRRGTASRERLLNLLARSDGRLALKDDRLGALMPDGRPPTEEQLMRDGGRGVRIEHGVLWLTSWGSAYCRLIER